MTSVDSGITISQLSFSYVSRDFEPIEIFRDFSLTVPRGNITAVVGPSGCGKSTLLRLIGGDLSPGGGVIQLAAEGRSAPLAYVFQAPTLVPWKTVRWNALLGVHARGAVEGVVSETCDRLLRRFRIDAFADRFPVALSGGMQQRLSLIRALVSNPGVLLLDEPFSGSDYFMRLELLQELGQFVDERKIATILVTHDLEDCLQVADRILLLTDRPATILDEIQVDTPRMARRSTEGRRMLEKAREKAWDILRDRNL